MSGWAREWVGERVGKKRAGGGAGRRLRTRVGEGVGGWVIGMGSGWAGGQTGRRVSERVGEWVGGRAIRKEGERAKLW